LLCLLLQLIAASVYNVAFMSVTIVPLMFFLGSSSDFLVGRVVLQTLAILWISTFNVAALMVPKFLLLVRLKRSKLPSGSDRMGTTLYNTDGGAAGSNTTPGTAPGGGCGTGSGHEAGTGSGRWPRIPIEFEAAAFNLQALVINIQTRS
jgi:hypothetical protein